MAGMELRPGPRPAASAWPRWRVAAVVTVAALSVTVLADLLDLRVSRHHEALLDGLVANPESMALVEDLYGSKEAVARLAFASLVIALITGVAFIVWLYQAALAVDRARKDVLHHRPGWAIGGWFVPFLNLVRPVQIVLDVHRAAPPGGGDPPRIERLLIGMWWTVFAGGWVVYRLSARNGAGGSLVPQGLHAFDVVDPQLSKVAAVVDLVAAVLAIAVVIVVTRRVAAVAPTAAGSPRQPSPEPS